MKLTKSNLTGMQYLREATELLHRIRLESSSAGLYEAADLQWWWREDDAAHSERQTFWHDAEGTPVACLLLFDSNDEWNNNLLFLPSAKDMVQGQILPEVIERLCTKDKPSILTVRDDDIFLQKVLKENKFKADAVEMVQAHLIGDSPNALLPDGFRLESRENATSPHPMIARNGPNIETKLGELSLYRPELDLCIRDRKEDVAAYALFWMDSITEVGLIEPMRTEVPFQSRGLAKYLIAEGVRRLKEEGAKLIKVTYKTDNEAAARLYHRAGFRDQFRKQQYRRMPSNK